MQEQRLQRQHCVTMTWLLQGHPEAWFHLGVMHLNGWATKYSQTQALHYFTLASKMGHVLATYNLAMMHLGSDDGQGERDSGHCEAALELLKKVAERGPYGAMVQHVSEHSLMVQHVSEHSLVYPGGRQCAA